jgi:hypothetical protein
MNEDHPQSNSDSSPLRDNLTAMIFMAFLLLMSAVTASVAGYRIKMADKDRKAQLYAAYEGMGGSRERLVNIAQSLIASATSPAQTTFLAAYEINERSRAFGLYRTLEFSKPENVTKMIAALEEIGATDHAHIVKDAWTARQEDPATANLTHPDDGPVNAKSARIAKQYTRRSARDVETKLFKFYADHKGELGTQP